MVQVKLKKRGHNAFLSFTMCEGFGYVLLITGTGDIQSIQTKIELGKNRECKDLFNSLIGVLVSNGYKLIEGK